MLENIMLSGDDVNDDGLTFAQWQRKVNRWVLGICGVTTEDLADYPSWDLWADGVSPREAAEICLVDWNDFDPDLLGFESMGE